MLRSSSHRNVDSVWPILLALLTLLSIPALPVRAAAYMVNTLADNATNGDGFCTLREAILVVNNTTTNDCGAAGAGNDSISFSVSGTIRLSSTLPAITGGAGTLTIDGGGAITLSGDTDNNAVGDVRVLIAESGADLTLRNLTISHGRADTQISGLLIGGGLFSSGTLTINNVRFQNNSADYAGALYSDGPAAIERGYFYQNRAEVSGGAVDNAGTMSIKTSSFIDNIAVDSGAAVLNFGILNIRNSAFFDGEAAYGAAIQNLSTMLIEDSYFNGNVASQGGGTVNNAAGTLTFARSTVSADRATSGGGGCIRNLADLTITNSTFSLCQAGQNGGSLWQASGTATVTNSTFNQGNAAGLGGAIHVETGAVLTLRNTILTGSTGGGDCVGTLEGASRNNLIKDNIATCGLNNGINGNIIGQDPQLGSLATIDTRLMYPLLPGSPAIDAGNNGACPATDQRGVLRPQDGDLNGTAVCDIGAYEAANRAFLPMIVR